MLVGLTSHAAVAGGQEGAFLAFLLAALTMMWLMFGLAIAIATAQDSLIKRLRARTPQIKRWSGLILIGVGTWTALLAIWPALFFWLFPT